MSAGERPGVAIVGLGLIGGSLARDLARAGVQVTGADRDRSVVERGLAEGVLHREMDPGDPLPDDVGLLVLATPVPTLPALLETLGRGAGGGTGAGTGEPGGGDEDTATVPVITDVGSTKRSVMAAAARVGLAHRFVGAHPMAGDHHRGWDRARPGLFEGAAVWICGGEARPEAIERVAGLWRSVGAVPRPIDAAWHDRLVAAASHLPQAAASALAAVLADAGVRPEDLGPGGRDATRLAGSAPELWAGILADNADEVLPLVEGLIARLIVLGENLRCGDEGATRRWLTDGAAWRDRTG